MMPFSIADCRLQVADWIADYDSSPTKALSIVLPLLYLLAPIAIVDVPTDGLAQAGFERVARRPSELLADFHGVDRVPAIVAGTIRNEGLQRAPAGGRRMQRVDGVADPVH